MKKSGKLLTALLLLLALSLCMFAACNGKGKTEAKVTLKTPRVTEYRVGDNVDLYDFIEYDESQEYSFKVAKNGSEAEPKEVKGRTYYAAESGKYSAEITAKSGEKSDSETVEFNVFEAVPFVRVLKSEFDVNYMRSVPMDWLIGQSAPYIKGNDYESYCDYVFYYEYADATGEKIELEEATADGFFDGNDRIKFIKEGIYVFHLIVENSGGLCDGSFTVNVYEDFSAVPDIAGGVIEYDEQTKTATWNKVENATDYRIKIDRKEAIVSASAENTYSLDITPYLTSEFQHFDLVVTARDDKAQAFGKITKEIIVSPEKYGKLVLSSGTKMNADTGVATLAGRYANSLGWMGVRDSLSNTYAAWSGDYGVGTFVEFEFTGNNMPQLCFFADKINGDITQGYDANRNEGILLLGGLYGQAFSNVYQTFWGDKLTVWGPNRGYMHCNSVIWTHYKTVTEDYPLFTQDGLTRAGDVTYKLVAGTYADGGTIMANLQLYNKSNGKLLHNAHISTGVKTTELSGGNIIAFSTVKGEDKPTEFTVLGKPYAGEPKYTLEEKDGVYAYNATFNSDDTVTIQSRQLGGAAFMSNLDSVNLGYISIDGNYGAGTYVDFTFKGNNMPYIVLFADRVNEGRNVLKGGKLTNTLGSKGLLLFNGLVTSRHNAEGMLGTSDPVEGNRLNSFHVFGPNRMKSDYTNANGSSPSIEDGKWLVNISGNDYPMFSQRGLDNAGADKEYKLTVGTFRNGDSLWIDVSIYDGATDEVIHSVQRDLGLTTEQIEYLGTGSIIAMANMKGSKDLYSTTFGYSKPYTKETILMNSGATFNQDGSVTLKGKLTDAVAINDNNKSQNYIAFKGNYGVGTYVDFAFKGNNMPNLMFFADNINGNFTSSAVYTDTNSSHYNQAAPSGKGLFILNGIYHRGSIGRGDTVQVWGLDRMSCNAVDTALSDDEGYRLILNDANYAPFTQNALSADANAEYEYIAGTYEKDEKVYLHLRLYKKVGSQNLLIGELNENTGIAVSDITSDMCNIIAYAAFKGADNDTTFTYSEPYEANSDDIDVVTFGARYNSDGSVTLNGKQSEYAWSQVGALKNSYVGLKGNYGVGTYIDFTFTGNNMPNICLFADNIDGGMSRSVNPVSGNSDGDGPNKGLMIVNGFYGSIGRVLGNTLVVCGPNRLVYAMNAQGGIINPAPAPYNNDLIKSVSYPYFTQNGLIEAGETKTYKLTVGTFLENGKVMLDMRIYNASDESLIHGVHITTNVKETDLPQMGTNIIIYAALKGTGNDTTLSYSEPYNGEPEESVSVLSSGAKYNLDSSVTLTGKASSVSCGAGDNILASRGGQNFVAFKGDYGVGTYIDFTFEGNNMPQLMFFADKIEGFFVSYKSAQHDVQGKGMFVCNGAWQSPDNGAGGSYYVSDMMQIWGPDRVTSNLHGVTTETAGGPKLQLSDAQAKLFTVGELNKAANANVKFRLVAGTYENNGTVWLDYKLYKDGTEEPIGVINVDTGINVSEITSDMCNIIAFPTFKGKTTTENNCDTTFSFSQPYTKTAA